MNARVSNNKPALVDQFFELHKMVATFANRYQELSPDDTPKITALAREIFQNND